MKRIVILLSVVNLIFANTAKVNFVNNLNGLTFEVVNNDKVLVRLNEYKQISETFVLPNTPNPFLRSTTLRFDLPQSGATRLAVFDAQSRLVRVLVDDERAAGATSVVWDGTDAAGRRVAPGVYYYQLSHGSLRTKGRMVYAP